jgi:hypothetical protein
MYEAFLVSKPEWWKRMLGVFKPFCLDGCHGISKRCYLIKIYHWCERWWSKLYNTYFSFLNDEQTCACIGTITLQSISMTQLGS